MTYFVCAGFEDRSLGLLSYLKDWGFQVKKVVIIEYLPFDETNRLMEVVNLAGQVSTEPIEIIKFDRHDPQNSDDINPDRLNDLIREGGSAVDISGMSRFLIVILCVRLLRMKKLVNLVYFEPEDYHPIEQEYYDVHTKEKRIGTFQFLSSGLYEILTVDDLTSGAMLGYPPLLVASPTFQPTFLRALLNELYPEKLILLEGVPPDPKRRWRKEKVRQLNQYAFDIASEDSAEISTADAQAVYDELQKISKQHRYTNRIILAPAASKMHALGIAAFIASGAQVEVIYPTPKEFKSAEYTKGIGKADLIFIKDSS